MRFSRAPIKSALIYIVLPLYILFACYTLLFAAPRNFPVEHMITIEEGMTLSGISDLLEEENIVRSSFWFDFFAIVFRGEEGAIAGDYYFEEKISVFEAARRITNGDYGLTATRVTVAEGATIEDMVIIFGIRFDNFDEEEFRKLTVGKEGFLFPDTYFFLPNVKTKEIVRTMEKNFETKTAHLKPLVKESGWTMEEIVIMASLLEKEARKFDTKRMIADILWRRIDIGMPLQVDAVFPYIIGKNTFELSLKDLQVDSPYNTYKYKGLPIGAIANPGLDSIEAALTPKANTYLFYLSDYNGDMHYAETFEGHKRNKRIYLN